MDKRTLVVIFEDLRDPRVARTRVHLLEEVLAIIVLAVIAGADGWDETVEWAEFRVAWLRTFLSLPGGIPSADTFRRIFCSLDPTKFAACFKRMIAELSGKMLDQLVAIDGKTMRRAFAKDRGQRPLHMVSAWVAERGVHLGQLATEAKSNEITAIPALLDMIDVRGATVSIHAEGCQKKIAEKIVDGGANYLLALKGNQPLLHEEVIEYFNHARHDRPSMPRSSRSTRRSIRGTVASRREGFGVQRTSTGSASARNGRACVQSS